MHVSSSDLQDVGDLDNQGDLLVGHDFGDDTQTCLFFDPGQNVQAFGSQPLEAVGGGPGFERAPAQDVYPGFFHSPGHIQHLVQALDGARAGHDDNFFAPNACSIDGNDRVFRFEVTAGEFERLDDVYDFVHSIHEFQNVRL